MSSEPTEGERTILCEEIEQCVAAHVEKRTGRRVHPNVQIIDNLVRTRPDNFISHEEFSEKATADKMRFILDSLESLDPNAVEVTPGLSSKRRATANVLVGYSSRYKERMETTRDSSDYFTADPFSLLVDTACVRKAVQLTRNHLAGGLFQQCTVHINLFNLMDQTYREILEIELRNVPRLIQRMIDFSIVRTSAAGAIEDVDEQIAFLKRYSRRVYFTTSTGTDPRFNVFDCSADGVGLFVDASAKSAAVDEQIRRIKSIVGSNKNKLPILLFGLPKNKVDAYLDAATPEFFTMKPEETRLPDVAFE